MVSTTAHHLARLTRVETCLAFLRRTWPLEHAMAEGLCDIELEVTAAIEEARYLGAMLDHALADLRDAGRIDDAVSELELEAPCVGAKDGGR